MFLNLIAAFFIVCASIQYHAYKNPGLNTNVELSVDDLFKRYPHKNSELLNCSVAYIQHSPKQCINPNFPSIRIISREPVDGWFHVVHTNIFNDAACDACFIDGCPELMPFYTYNASFYDAPLWSFNILRLRIQRWQGHAYRTKIDHENKVIHVSDGIAWGFTLGRICFSPVMIAPHVVSAESKKNDLMLIQNALQEKGMFYNLISVA